MTATMTLARLTTVPGLAPLLLPEPEEPVPPDPLVPPPVVVVPFVAVPFETVPALPLSAANPMAVGLYRKTEYTFFKKLAPTIQLMGD